MQDSDLFGRKRRARVGHHVLQSALVHGDYIRVTFHHVHAVGLHDGAFPLVDAVQLPALAVDFAVGRVHVLLLYTLGTTVEHSTAEAYHPSAHVEPREDDTPTETVAHAAILTGIAQPRLQQILLAVPATLRLPKESIRAVHAESELELPDDFITDATVSEVRESDGSSVGMMVKRVTEVILGELVHDEHTLPCVLHLPFLSAQLLLRHLDVVFLGKPTERFAVVQLLVLHNEMNCAATLATGEALAQPLGWRHIEGRTLVGMKRTEADVVHAPLLQRNELGDYIYYLCCIEYAVYGWLVYHLFDLCCLISDSFVSFRGV